jgi:hypothetical protein
MRFTVQPASPGNVPPLRVPYLNLRALGAAPLTQDGTLWYGTPSGGVIGLYVFLNGMHKAVDLMPHALNNSFSIEAQLLTEVICNGQSKRVGTHESAGQTFKHRSFFDWDTSSIPDGATIDKGELEVTISSGMTFGNTNVQVTKRFNLGAAAATVPQDSLGVDWFSVGMKTSLEDFGDFMSIGATGEKLHVSSPVGG